MSMSSTLRTGELLSTGRWEPMLPITHSGRIRYLYGVWLALIHFMFRRSTTLHVTKDRSGTRDNARRLSGTRTAVRQPPPESAVGRSMQFARTLGGLVPSAPAELPQGERGVGVRAG
jgi:hypothetical protein